MHTSYQRWFAYSNYKLHVPLRYNVPHLMQSDSMHAIRFLMQDIEVANTIKEVKQALTQNFPEFPSRKLSGYSRLLRDVKKEQELNCYVLYLQSMCVCGTDVIDIAYRLECPLIPRIGDDGFRYFKTHSHTDSSVVVANPDCKAIRQAHIPAIRIRDTPILETFPFSYVTFHKDSVSTTYRIGLLKCAMDTDYMEVEVWLR